jgi:hypothetical protein
MSSEEPRDDYSLELVNVPLLFTHLVATNINEHYKSEVLGDLPACALKTPLPFLNLLLPKDACDASQEYLLHRSPFCLDGALVHKLKA